MQPDDTTAKTNADDTAPNPLWGRLALLMFGLTVLAFLTAIDRPEWFHLKPVTGTAAAMVYASDNDRG